MGATGMAVLSVVATVCLWVAPSGRPAAPRRGSSPRAPLISRGYTEAPAGTVVVAGNPMGGATVIDLRIKDGQKVKRDEIIAVLSAYPAADISVRMAEAALTKLKQTHDTVLMGTRVTQIDLQEATLKSSIENNKLAALAAPAVGQHPTIRKKWKPASPSRASSGRKSGWSLRSRR